MTMAQGRKTASHRRQQTMESALAPNATRKILEINRCPNSPKKPIVDFLKIQLSVHSTVSYKKHYFEVNYYDDTSATIWEKEHCEE